MLKQEPAQYLFGLVSLVVYIIVGYFIPRHQTGPLFISYLLLFIVYIVIIRRQGSSSEVTFWIIGSVLFRLALLFAIPALSDDFYRFIWDGRLLAAGHSPFSEVPSFYMDRENTLPGLDAALYDKLNSRERFSSYPPVCQFVYWLSVKLSPASVYGSILVMRSVILLFEIGTLLLLKRLLLVLRLQQKTILVYALNPLVILELTGNLHFEGVMIFFLFAAMYLLIKNRPYTSALSFALSVCTKLIPLLLLPMLFRLLGWRKSLLYWTLTCAITVLLFLPILDEEIVRGFSTSLGYYFQHFEFNASFYYLIRAAGFLVFGFNIIGFAGPALAMIGTVLILWIAFRRPGGTLTSDLYPGFFAGMLWSLLIYFASTTILHPWYIITLLAISLFTPYQFPILWTGLIFLTYAGYTKDAFRENLILVAVEYIALVAFIYYETLWTSRTDHS